MPLNTALLTTARCALRDALGVGEGTEVLVVDDATVPATLAESFAAAAWALGARVTTMRHTRDEYVSARRFGVFAEASTGTVPPLPPAYVSALAAAEVSVILNSDMSLMFDPGIRQIIGEGRARLAWMPYVDEDSMLRLLPSTAAGWQQLVATTTTVGEIVDKASDVVVRSGQNSELRLNFGDHRTNCSTGVPGSGGGFGGLEVWPGGQVSRVPNAGTAEGTLTITRSVNAPEFRELFEPIELVVREGYVTEVRGEGEAARLRTWLASLEDPEAYHITEVGIGTNVLCEFAGVSAPCEDTHMEGCVSFALGADVHLGGVTRARCHVDMATGGATYIADGRAVVSAGRLEL